MFAIPNKLFKMEFMNLHDDAVQRLSRLIEVKFKSVTKFALAVGINSMNVYHILNGRNRMSIELAEKFSAALGIEPAELFTDGRILRDGDIKMMVTPDESKFRAIPQLSPASCGATGIESDGHVLGWKYFEESFLARFINPRLTIAVGYSMEPLIFNGDLVLVDCDPEKRANPTRDGVYLVNVPETLEEESYTIKRVVVAGGVVILVPTNTKFDIMTIEIDGRHLTDIILGEVVWSGHDFKR